VIALLTSDKQVNDLLGISAVSEATEDDLVHVLPGGGGQVTGAYGAVHVSLYDCGSPKQVEMVEGRTAHVCMDKLMAEREAGNTWLVGAGATGAGPCNGELIVVASLGSEGGGDTAGRSSGLPRVGVTSPADRDTTRAGIRSVAVYADPALACPVSTRPYRSLCVGPVANMVAGPPVTQLRAATTCVRLQGRGIKAVDGSTNLISVLNDVLRRGFASRGQVAWAAVTRVTSGSVKAHVMPPFPDHDLSTPALVNDWLQFYEMPAPLTMYTAAITDDRHEDGLRLEHTHFTSDTGAGGHFHHTTTPEHFAYDVVIIFATRLFKEEGSPASHS